jgi:hypothetical protein
MNSVLLRVTFGCLLSCYAHAEPRLTKARYIFDWLLILDVKNILNLELKTNELCAQYCAAYPLQRIKGI